MERINNTLTNLTFLIPTASLAVGILIAETSLSIFLPISLIVTSLILCFIFTYINQNVQFTLSLGKYNFIWIILLFAGLGALSQYLNRPSKLHCPSIISPVNLNTGNCHKNHNLCRHHRISAEIVEINTTTANERLLVKLITHTNPNSQPKAINNSYAYLYTSPTNFRTGDIIIFPCALNHISPKSEESYQYYQYLNHHNILYRQTITETSITRLKHTNHFYDRIRNIRNYLEENIELSPLNRATSNFLITLLLGDKRYADKETREALTTSGLAHILALSGMHISIICSLLFAILFPLNAIGKYKLRYFLTPAILWIYVLLTGAAPSTVRAAIMATLCLWAVTVERKNSAINALLASIFIILLISPEALHDIGLQLSILAVASILLFARPLNPIHQHHHPHTYSTIAILLTTLIAALSTSILSAYYFHKLPLMFVPQNLLIVPLLPIYVTIAIIYLLCGNAGINLPILNAILEKGFEFTISFTTSINDSGNYLLEYAPSLGVVVAFIVWLIIAAYVVNKMHSKKGFFVILFSSVILIVTIFFSNSTPTPYIYGIDQNSSGVYITKKNNCHNSSLLATPHTNTIISIANCEIIILDNVPDSVSVKSVINGLRKAKTKPASAKFTRNNKPITYYVISSGCYANPNQLANSLINEYVILHNSLNIKKEQKLLEAFNKHNIKTHSIRQSGEYIFPVSADMNH